MSAFGVLLGEWMERRGFTYRSLAKALGTGPSTVNQIKQGKRTPPLERLDDFCEALQITGPDRIRFINLAHVSHLPDAIQPRFEAFLEEHEKLKADYARLEKRVAERFEEYDKGTH